MNFKELRAEKNKIKTMLNYANNTVKRQMDEIDTLNRIIDIKNNQIACLNHELEEDKEYIARLKRRLKKFKEDKNKYYKLFVESNKITKSQLFYGVCFLSFIQSIMIIFLMID